jgi:hypothetical protein
MPKFHVEATAMVAQTVIIDADCLETAEQIAMDELKQQLQPHSVYDFDIYDSYEVE